MGGFGKTYADFIGQTFRLDSVKTPDTIFISWQNMPKFIF